jgi:hypothetical protein
MQSSKRVLTGVMSLLAVAACAVPATASADNWAPSGAYTITTPALDISIPALGLGWTCSASIDADADASSTLTVTGVSMTGCSGAGSATGCGVVVTANNLDWSADGTDPSDVQIAGVDADLLFTSGCIFTGSTVHVAGTLTGGVYDNGSHSVTFTGAGGLSTSTSGSPLGGLAVTGTLTDPTGTLTLS